MLSYLLISNTKKQVNSFLKKIVDKNYLFFPINIEEGKKEYSINQIKNIIKETLIYSEKIRVYFFENFHQSSIETQNSFLKLLEEPPKNVFFILTTDNQSKILPTIISRVKVVYLDKKNYQINEEKKKIIDSFIKNKKFLLIDSTKLDINDLLIYFKNYLKTCFDKNISKKVTLILKEILKKIYLIENNNLNKQIAIDNLLILIHKIFHKS